LKKKFKKKIQKNIAIPRPLLHGGGEIAMQQSHQPTSGEEGGLQYCFEKKLINFKKNLLKTTLESSRPYRGAVVHNSSSMGAGGLQCNRATSQRRRKADEIFLNFFFFFFLETLQSLRPCGGAVVHDGSFVGARGLQCDRAAEPPANVRGGGGLKFFFLR
jgi:hypothetical protein